MKNPLERMQQLTVILALLALMFGATGVTPVHAAGTVSVCDESHLTTALSGGGTVTFSCSGTITVTNAFSLFSDTTLNGAGQTVTLSGGGTVQLFEINGITFNVQNITLADGSGGYGGAIYNNYGILNVTNVTFSNNKARRGGAIASENTDATATIINSTFSGNRVENYGDGGAGGAIFNGRKSTLTVINSTFSGNISPNLADNNNYTPASGIYNLSNATLKNTLIANGTDGAVPVANCYNDGTLTDGGGNLEDRNDCGFTAGTSKTSTTPLLGTLDYYGGTTKTFPLLPGSPAIDAGVNAICSAAPVNGKDQRGVTRPSACDMGAFESQGFTLGSLTGTPQYPDINTPFATPLGLTVTSAFGEPVIGGKVTFTPPASGASAVITGSPATIGSDGKVSITATANSKAGSYAITASAAGAGSVDFTAKNYLYFTTTSLDTSLNPSAVGDPVTFTATISPSAATGSVEFQADGTDIPGCANVSVSSGKATCTTATLAVGMRTITALYSGDSSYSSSDETLSPQQQVLNCAHTITVTSNADSGAGSLREAIAGICLSGTINFDADHTITLASTLSIGGSMTIDGSGHTVIVSGNNAVTVFTVNSTIFTGNITFNLNKIFVENGKSSTGGAASPRPMGSCM